jgi:hypothetical protein
MIRYIPILFLCFSCSAFVKSLPLVAQAANLVCDSLKEAEKFSLQVESVKQSIENENYKEALYQAKSLLLFYDSLPSENKTDPSDVEFMNHLRSLISLLENLNVH